MDNISRITNKLYVGGDPMYSGAIQEDIDLIVKKKMIVVDARAEDEQIDGWDEVLPEHVPLVKVPLHDDGKKNDYLFFADFFDQVRDAGWWEKPMFIHCHMGVNRAPSLALFVMVVRDHPGMSAEEAFRIILNRRPGAGIAYAEQAAQAAAKLHGHSVTRAKLTMKKFRTDYLRDNPEYRQATLDRIRVNRLHAEQFFRDYGIDGFDLWLDDQGIGHATRKASEALCDHEEDGRTCDKPAPHCVGGDTYYCDDHMD